MNEGRREILQLVFVLVGIVFLIKLFFIQVLDNKYAELADSNAILRQVEYPFRGLISDRNGKLIVYNTPEYDVTVIQKDVKNFDSTRFCEVFGNESAERIFACKAHTFYRSAFKRRFRESTRPP
jgi:penicillin-binding protein 2